MNINYETFTGRIIKYGDGLGVSIPAKTATFSGIKAGDYVRVLFKKVTPKQSEEKK